MAARMCQESEQQRLELQLCRSDCFRDQKRFDEAGYILQPPCIWGKAKHGLEPPVDVDGVTLITIKTSNATAGHHGEMAWQQMFMVDQL